MTASRRLGWALVAAALVLSPGAWAQAAPDDDAMAEADRLAHTGWEAYQRNDFDAAVEQFGAAYAIAPVPPVGIWLARALAERGQLREAAEVYEKVLAYDSSGATPQVRKADEAAQRQAREEIPEIVARVPFLTVKLSDHAPRSERSAVEVTVDGVPVPQSSWSVVRVNPGEHQVEARRGTERLAVDVECGEGALMEAPITLDEGDRCRVVIATSAAGKARSSRTAAADATSEPEQDRSSAQRSVGYGLLVLGAAGAVTGGAAYAYGLSYKAKLDDSNDCQVVDGEHSCGPSQHDRLTAYNSARVVETVALAVGGVGVGLGVTLLLTDRRRGEHALALEIGPGTARLRGRF